VTIHVDGKSFPVTVTRKRMKRVIMRFRNDTFWISAPKKISLAWLHAQLQKHGPKLYQKVKAHHPPYDHEGMYCLGTWYPWTTLHTIIPGIIAQDGGWLHHRKILISWWIKQITPRIRLYERQLHIQKPYRIRVREMRTRLGSNAKKTHALTFALKLIHFDWPIIDAVIVHELIHDQHFHHQPSFYQALLKAYPRYHEEHAKILKGQYR
jgi:predicted metal-dependent hydrolase